MACQVYVGKRGNRPIKSLWRRYDVDVWSHFACQSLAMPVQRGKEQTYTGVAEQAEFSHWPFKCLLR